MYTSSFRCDAQTGSAHGKAAESEGEEGAAGSEFLKDATDLTTAGHYTSVGEYIPFRRSLRFRTLHNWRPARRSRDSQGDVTECEGHENQGCFREALSAVANQIRCLFASCGCCKGRDGKLWFGFTMTKGTRNMYLRIVRQRPVVAMFMWSLLFLCETAMVAIYLAQVESVEKGVTWSRFARDEFGVYFYISSALSILLLSQLVFAYSFSLITVAVVLATTIYQIFLLITAFGFGLGWVSRMYVPLFLRCWPMRQYFLFLLDSVALLSPCNDRLDVVRLAAPSLSLFFTTVFTAACIFQLQELLSGAELNTIDSLYFIMTTISTTGFGDVLPHGVWGRLLTMGIIFAFLAKMPSWIVVVVGMVKMLGEFPQYGGPPHHFIVYGHVSREDAAAILDEVIRLYPTKWVCFCNASFPRDVLSLGRHPCYRTRSTFMVVKALNRRALDRMRVSEADAIIISPTSDGAAKARDDNVLLSSVTFQRHAPCVQQYLQLRFGAHVKLLRGRETMIDQNMRGIMASALILPGIVPFLVNLVRTASAGGSSSDTLWSEGGMDNWKELYEYSRRATFGTLPVPWFFVHAPLRTVVHRMKVFNVLVVGVEEGTRKLMQLDLEYVLEREDTILVLHENGCDDVARALKALDPTAGSSGELRDNGSAEWDLCAGSLMADAPQRSASLRGLLNAQAEEFDDAGIDNASLFYPFNASFEVLVDGNEEVVGRGATSPGGGLSASLRDQKTDTCVAGPGGTASFKSTNAAFEQQVQALRRRLLRERFVDKRPGGVSLAHLPLGGSLAVLTYLLNLHKAGRRSCEPADSSFERLEQQINDILKHVSGEFLSGKCGKPAGENFLFIDHVSSFKQPLLESMYDHYLNEHASRFELLQMMRCIRGIHSRSRVTLLSWQKLSASFLRWWDSSFEFPLRYIRGMSTMESHLNYAIKESGGPANLRGILLYCSQLGHWDFADVPLVAVENNIRAILDWASIQQEERMRLIDSSAPRAEVEQQVMVELKSFKSCISVTPHHTDPEWRRRGELHFQYSLAFMMGRCFSTNMLQTLFIHAHRNRRIMGFFNNVLCWHQQGNVFDVAGWNTGDKSDPTLFKACGNQLLHFQTFGDLFIFLLKRRSWVAIGVFRRFPATERLSGVPRYFITNPPMEMPLRADDVVYALSGTTGVYNRMGY